MVLVSGVGTPTINSHLPTVSANTYLSKCKKYFSISARIRCSSLSLPGAYFSLRCDRMGSDRVDDNTGVPPEGMSELSRSSRPSCVEYTVNQPSVRPRVTTTRPKRTIGTILDLFPLSHYRPIFRVLHRCHGPPALGSTKYLQGLQYLGRGRPLVRFLVPTGLGLLPQLIDQPL